MTSKVISMVEFEQCATSVPAQKKGGRNAYVHRHNVFCPKWNEIKILKISLFLTKYATYQCNGYLKVTWLHLSKQNKS